ncbi:hypothetical protein HPB47_022404 [Ixodes persulcatus]|uniref:Uncharacterized protein n=1 Tax=Ixodes persulcatus TaxID=34615 RepID=A0AC60Q9T1_IXOPE|nr:hypothetical protein HPB47_022404 [Ixodes persulcatus]
MEVSRESGFLRRLGPFSVGCPSHTRGRCCPVSRESWELPRYARLLCSDSGSLRKKRSPRSTSVIAVRSKDAAPGDRRCSLCTLSALTGLDAGPDLRRTNFLEFE